MIPKRQLRLTWLCSMVGMLAAQAAFAHPMGNFSINHYTRLTAQSDRIDGRYILDIAEIPTVTEMNRLDANQDGIVSEAERTDYLRAMSAQLCRELMLTINEQPVTLDATPKYLALLPGAGGLKTLRLTFVFTAQLPLTPSHFPRHIVYKDNNYPVRTGWKEIITTSDTALVQASSVPSTDLSNELTVYPADPSIAPPQVTEARFALQTEPGEGGETNRQPVTGARTPPSNRFTTPRDPFTQSIVMARLTPMLMGLALLSAFGFGALHALSPGHGKAMVAAYLIGTHGTARHAVLLGVVVTLTHTIGVFALGLLTLSASRYIVPERLYPIISGLSGFAVTVMGAGLLWHRLRAWRAFRAELKEPRGYDDIRATSAAGNSSANISRDEEEFYAQRRDAKPLSLRTLIGLGITGGALPCPSALVVMLSAIALHRTGFGLLLIVAFSLGLAVVLTILGLLVMRARCLMERASPVAKFIPGLSVLSAGAVTLIGLLLLFRSLTGRF